MVLTIAMALGWAELRVLTIAMALVWSLSGRRSDGCLFCFCIGEVWALAFPALAVGHVPLAGDSGCRWLAGLAAGSGGAGYRVLE